MGASVSVIVVNTKTAAAIGNNVQITAKNLAVSAIGKEKITAIIVNGAAAGSNGSAVAAQSGSQRDPDQYPGRCWNRNLQSDRKHEGNRR